jgi:predicted ABC-type ATPase
MSEQINEQEEALKAIYQLREVIKRKLFSGRTHRNIRREFGLSLKKYLAIMSLPELPKNK